MFGHQSGSEFYQLRADSGGLYSIGISVQAIVDTIIQLLKPIYIMLHQMASSLKRAKDTQVPDHILQQPIRQPFPAPRYLPLHMLMARGGSGMLEDPSATARQW